MVRGSYWQCGEFRLELSTPKIMAVINLTPDSFSDGGRYSHVSLACEAVDHACEAGADIIDLGAESSRPGAVEVSAVQEWERLKPVLDYAVRQKCCVSVDTYKPSIMAQAMASGASIINDIRALSLVEDDAIWKAFCAHQIGVSLMHMKGVPQTMQNHTDYEPSEGGVLGEVTRFLEVRAALCISKDLQPAQIVLDVGIGFAKTFEQNLLLLRALSTLKELGYPLLVGVSRKSMIGQLTHEANPEKRVAGSVAAALYAVSQGASIVRVHDVKATVDAFRVWNGLQGE